MSLALPMTGLLGGIVLLCSFMQLYQRRAGAIITLSQLAAFALAALALFRATVQFYLVAGLVVGLAGILLPWCLRRLAECYDQPVALAPMAIRLVLGVVLVALVLAIMPPAYQDMAVALAALLLAMLLMLVQAHTLIWVIGLSAMVNSMVLALLSLPSLPFIVVWVAILLALPLVGALILVWCRKQEANL